MPQRGRGGKRTGAPGVNYSNRTDLQQAPRAVPGQVYGRATQQLEAQRQMPLPRAGGASPGGVSPAPLPLAPRAPLTPLDAPSERPDEPLTAGLSSGPGPGREALTPPDPLVKFAASLNSLGDVADPATQDLRRLVNQTLFNNGAA